MAIRYVVSDHDAGLHVALSGQLELADVGRLRLRLFKCLAEQPDAVFVDIAGLTVSQPLALTVFAVVARQAARWPGTPVVLCGPTAPTRTMLAEAPYRRLAVFPDVEAAAADVGSFRRSLPSLSDELLPMTGAVRQARNVATEACLRWELPHLIAPASLIADELVSNVSDHANTMATLRLALRPRYLTVAVQDGSQAPPVIAPGPAAGRGRGLLLVEASAHSWGWMPTEGGKVVWASLSV